MRIIKEGSLKATRESLEFFKEHHFELGEIKYLILYYAEQEWAICRNPDLYHQYVIIVGETAQLWMSGLTWGYHGEGPYGLFNLLKLIDAGISYEDIVGLECEAKEPIMYEKIHGKLILKPFNESAKEMICKKNGRLPWDIRDFIVPKIR